MKNVKYFALILSTPLLVGLTIAYPTYFAWFLWAISIFVFSLFALGTVFSITGTINKTASEIDHIPQWKVITSRFITGLSIGVLFGNDYYALASIMLINMVYGIWFVNYIKAKANEPIQINQQG